MIDVSSYIKMVLEKKKWTRTKLCQEINKIESKLGEKRTTTQNITNYLNGMYSFRPKILAKWEQALGLARGSLINMVAPPLGKDAKQELRETIERLDKVR